MLMFCIGFFHLHLWMRMSHNFPLITALTVLFCFLYNVCRTSLAAQWLRTLLPMQGTRVRVLVQKDPTCHRSRKPVHNYWACALEPTSRNYWACALEPTSHNYRACKPQPLKPACLEPVFRNKRSHCNEKTAHHNKEQPPPTATRESLRTATKTQCSQK